MITPKPPYPEVDGGTIAMANTLEMLQKIAGKVELLCLSTYKHPFYITRFPVSVREKIPVHNVSVDTRVRPHHLFRMLYGSGSYRASRFYSGEAAQQVEKLLATGTFTHVWLESVYAAVYLPVIRRYGNIKVILRTHNIEHRIWQNVIRNESNPVKKWLLRTENKKLEAFERDLFRNVDGLVHISPEDAAYAEKIDGHASSVVVPFGIRTEKYQPVERPDTRKLFHLGAMDWEPNREAMKWFINDIFPGMLAVNPELEFHMAGRGMPQHFLSLRRKNVIAEGEVAEAADFMRHNGVLVVPLRSGSGVRIKILEAMAMGIPVITTSAGMGGITARKGEHLFTADSPEEFAQLARLLKEAPEKFVEAGLNGRKLIREEYDATALAERIRLFLINLAPQNNANVRG